MALNRNADLVEYQWKLSSLSNTGYDAKSWLTSLEMFLFRLYFESMNIQHPCFVWYYPYGVAQSPNILCWKKWDKHWSVQVLILKMHSSTQTVKLTWCLGQYNNNNDNNNNVKDGHSDVLLTTFDYKIVSFLFNLLQCIHIASTISVYIY